MYIPSVRQITTHWQPAGLVWSVVFIIAMALPFWWWPGADIWVSSWFFNPQESTKFPFQRIPFFMLARQSYKFLFGCGLVFCVILFYNPARGWVQSRTFLQHATPQFALAALFTAIVANGVVINLILKSYWGRARPVHITEFLGNATHSLPWELSNQCIKNCSFSSGEAAIGFWFVLFAVATSQARFRRVLVLALAYAALVSFSRIAQGGHFLSDVLASWAIVWFVFHAAFVAINAIAPAPHPR